MQYTTAFPGTENPLSESGNWINGLATGLDWANCRKTPARCFGTQSGAGGFNDSTALLIGTWGANQDAQATVFLTEAINNGESAEVELRLRSALTAHSNTGYEVLFNVSASLSYGPQIVKWNGALGDFTVIAEATGGAVYRAVNGDVIRAVIDGTNTITVYVNGVQKLQFQDVTSPYTSGNPGLGFFTNTGSQDSSYGFSDYTVTDGLGGVDTVGRTMKFGFRIA